VKLWRREWREPLGNFNRNRREMDSTGCRRSRASPGFSFVGCIVMNFEDERYVRLFTRDSLTWLSWGWETRAVFVLTLRKLDRAGVLDTGKMDKSTAVALLIGVPNDVASRALKQLTSDGTATETPNAIVFPRFLEAQECKQSDAHRQRESRVNRRTKAVSERIHEVVSHTASHGVTDGHTVSQLVTPAVPSQPCLAEPAVPSKRDVPSVDASLNPVVREIFDYWVQAMGAIKSIASKDRLSAISARLAEGFTPEDIREAIDGCARNPFNMGQNDTGTKYNDIKLICRSASKIEQYKSTTGKPQNNRAPVAAESVDWTKVPAGEVDL